MRIIDHEQEANAMAWIGRKKIAFIPLHRPNAHPPDAPVPTDWPNDILRRVLFDPLPGTKLGTDPAAGKADRSLRAYIHAASSGRADLDAVVMPMEILDRQDVPPNALDGKLGAQLHAQGFDAAALVMLGQPPTGQAESLGGFWARFDMSEGVGTWAMELMHCLTGFDDLYPFDGNMGAFDEMAGSAGTHPSAYTKAAIGWLDSSAIVPHHTGQAASYNLHSVGLVQPPPSGRLAAVRIGAQVPYQMVEARQRVDQFDTNISSEGVIVYQVQTTSPHGTTQGGVAPIKLLTTTALTVGQTFTSGTHLKVTVVSALPGGFTVRVDDSLTAVGFVTDYESERVDPDRPPGANNPLLQTIELDSMPGFAFTATGGPVYAAVVHKAQQDHRKVEIAYTPSGAQSGKIISVKLK
jgi:hypothetical protein